MFIEVLCECVSGVMRNRHERGVVGMGLLSDMQWAYQKGKSTEAPLVAMNLVAEWAVVHRDELWDIGFDIRRCFDSYEWEMREVCLRRTGVGEEFINMKRALEEGSEMVLLTKWGYSKVKGVAQRGIPQGGEDSPLDFMCMNDVHMRMLERHWEGGYMMRAGGKEVRVKACGYGDDLRCMAASKEGAQQCVDIGSAVFYFFGLEASPTKMWVRRLRFDEKGGYVE